MLSLNDLTIDNMLDPRVATGKRGRPRGTGKRDGQSIYDVAKVLAANPKMTMTDAIRSVVTDPKDYNAVDRIGGKLAKLPGLRKRAIEHHEGAVKRVLASSATTALYFTHCGIKSRRDFDEHFRAKFVHEYEVLNDKRVKAYANKLWLDVKPYAQAFDAMEIARQIEELLPLNIRNFPAPSSTPTTPTLFEREMARITGEAMRHEKLYPGTLNYPG
jgi:hypothetical protein